ncbi:MAG: class I SAM-dependent methyltransferase [Candidatus Dormibacteraeota bacterium]|uniref:Class I SAM-dependent methyltransferase n=1 Tax=Candidatus Dormiibacter inghamiae TaxID=3127013 RepID=A0A934NCH8_9BACT|nr:class I SAM-dependent methyltransferase [Candidatus Dormibacteraeota bacterium]MBJ7607532.1 class I SAM-dependent methyltransferase [Candidatus Dormibacteraeota bacterium]
MPPARFVRDDPLAPDPGFAELYGQLPEVEDLEPWLAWCRPAGGPVLYLGVGAGRLALPLLRAGVELVGVDAHPGMLAILRRRSPGLRLLQARLEDLALTVRFPLVMAPSGLLQTEALLRRAALLSTHWLAFELLNPHWLLASPGPGVRVLATSGDSVRLEVDYLGGQWTQQAEVQLTWPERIEHRLLRCGLELVVMRGASDKVGLSESPTFAVLSQLLE